MASTMSLAAVSSSISVFAEPKAGILVQASQLRLSIATSSPITSSFSGRKLKLSIQKSFRPASRMVPVQVRKQFRENHTVCTSFKICESASRDGQSDSSATVICTLGQARIPFYPTDPNKRETMLKLISISMTVFSEIPRPSKSKRQIQNR